MCGRSEHQVSAFGNWRIAAHKPGGLTALSHGNIVRLHATARKTTIAQEKLTWPAQQKRSRVCRNPLARNK
jgi:hypothetical protein